MPTPNALIYARHVEDRKSQYDRILSELGYDCLLIHSGRPEVRLFDDQHPPFRAHAPFAAWVPQPFAVDGLLELRPGHRPRLWFCQPDDFWHLAPEAPAEWWADSLDIEVVTEPKAWHERFSGSRALAVLGRKRDLGALVESADLNPPELLRRVDELRTVKTAWERECIAQANRTAARAHIAASRTFYEGGSELDIHLSYLAAAGQDQDHLPYNSIVALNEHAAVLHYQYRSPQPPKSRRSFLIDAGADFCGYAADVTRTWAASESGLFGELIESLDRLQSKLCNAMRAGRSYVDLHRQAHLGVAGLLEQIELVRAPPDQIVESGVSGYFLPHGLGHFLGAQVHDVAGKQSPEGKPLSPPEEFPALRLTRTLQVGNVVTVEPGLYFIPVLLEQLRASRHASWVDWAAIDKLIPYGGIRIEDNVLVTEGESVNFTRQAFAEASG
jgi:Xaa-Pro dipeptidase